MRARGQLAALAAPLLSTLLLAACPGPDRATPAPVAAPAAAPAAVDTAELLENLSFLATGVLPPAETIQLLTEQLSHGQLTMAGYIDALLADPRFARDVAPRILLAEWQANGGLYALPKGYVLQRTAPDPAGRIALYLREGCAPEAARKVRPWWDLDAEVLVCDEAYQPEHFADATGHHCDGIMLAPGESSSRFCGCGPNLIRCFPDADRYAKVSRSLIDEVNLTTAKIVGDDRPIRELYTRNETFRDRDAEFIYRRWRVESGELAAIPDLRDWPEAGQWAPRYEMTPGQHAGILTTTQVIFRETGLRSITKNIYDKIWCKDAESANVQAQRVLALHATNLRAGEGWEQLAHQPICEGCHARLDYGMQFLNAYADVRIATHFTPRAATRGALYGNDSKDLRGTAELSPRGFAELAVKQPEFAACMVQDVTRHVFNHRASPADTRAVREALDRAGTLREMVRVALQRYAESYGHGAAAPPPVTALPAAKADAAGRIALSPRLRALVEEHCGDCHGEGAPARDLRPAALPRATLAQMLTNVAFEVMPKDGPLAPEARLAVVTELIASLWSGERERIEASHYFGDRMRALPIHRGPQVVELVRRRAGGEGRGQIRLMETTVRQDQAQLTPGFAAVIGLEALRACKAAGHEGAALERCLEAATEPRELVNGLDR